MVSAARVVAHRPQPVSEELAFAPALELAAQVRERKVSPVELTELYLERIERLDPQLNSYVTVDGEGALAAAHAAVSTTSDAPFHGVPISIKDLNETAGLRTTYSTKACAANVPRFDAAVVRRIREAGFIVLGKTNTPEFGTIAMTESELNGDCRNPWDVSRTPGGSSGGAAAATAAGLCPAAHGSDGGGSIRIPSSCCGLFGIKPSRGRVSPAPYGSGSLGLGTSGPIARTVRDAAALLDVMSGYETGDFFVAPAPERPFLAEAELEPGRLRIAVTTTPPIDVPVDPSCVAAVDDAAALLAELGHDVIAATPPWVGEDLILHFIRIWQVGPATAGIDDLSQLEPINRMLAEQARETPSPEHAAAIMQLQRLTRTVVAFWDDVDVLLTPTLALPPVPIGWTFDETGGNPQLAFDRQTLFTPFTAVDQRHGSACDVGAAALERGWPADRRAAHRQAVRRGDALPARRAARAGEAVDRPPAPAAGDVDRGCVRDGPDQAIWPDPAPDIVVLRSSRSRPKRAASRPPSVRASDSHQPPASADRLAELGDEGASILHVPRDDETRVVAGDRADDLGMIHLIERPGDRRCGAELRVKDDDVLRERRPASELRGLRRARLSDRVDVARTRRGRRSEGVRACRASSRDRARGYRVRSWPASRGSRRRRARLRARAGCRRACVRRFRPAAAAAPPCRGAGRSSAWTEHSYADVSATTRVARLRT